MVSAPGPLLARGRDADVYDLGDGRVLRRYRHARSALDEGAVMQHVRAHGYPAPRVDEVAGPDLVMERVAGPTLLAEATREPWRISWAARVLAELHRRLHALPAPDWFPRRLEGDAVVHLDLHPGNVVLSPEGPVVIDWTNAGRGDPSVETAHTWLLMATSVPPGGPWQRLLAAAGRRLFLRAFLAGFDLDELRAHLPTVAAHRRADRNVVDGERRAIDRFLRREGL